MITQRPCPRCGRPIFESTHRRPGRPRRWCSAACRRADYAERQAARRGLDTTIATEQHVEAVLQSPTACRRVLRQIGEWAGDGTLQQAKWSSVADEMARLVRRVPLRGRWL